MPIIFNMSCEKIHYIFILSFLALRVNGFSIPGVSIKSYKQDDPIPVYANELDSIKTQLPFSYYFLKYCPAQKSDATNETLGSILLGETTENTPFKISMDRNVSCMNLCNVTLDLTDVQNFQWVIEREYFVNLNIDGLPAIFEGERMVHVGFPVGRKENGEYYLNNHLTFIIQVHADYVGGPKRIVGFYISPQRFLSVDSISYQSEDGTPNKESYCEKNKVVGDSKFYQRLEQTTIFYTYDVIFQDSNTAFGSRWDHYKFLGNDRIHWLSISNSIMIISILAFIIGYILKKTVKNQINAYNQLKTSEDLEEDSGWKQIAREVFRPPSAVLLLSVFTGTGVQVGSMIILTVLFAGFGFMDKSYRGSLLTTIILFYNFMGIFAGYYSARIYKMFNGAHWIRCTIMTAILYPGILFILFYIINIMMIFEESSGAVHIVTILTLICLWFGISTPLVFIGSLIGYKKPAIENPCKYNPIPKSIKSQPWYLKGHIIGLLSGLLPFVAMFIELVYIMNSIWRHSFYYFFAVLIVVAIILLVVCAEISIVITYLQLCNGNHRIWWRSFLNTGSMAIYVFVYGIFYYITELKLERFSSIFMYFGYMLAISATLFIVCGTTGFLASYIFVRTIYSLIKID